MQGNVELVVPPPVEGVRGGGTGYGWTDAVVKNPTRLVDVTRHPTGDLLHVWPMPNTATIGHQEPPRPLERVIYPVILMSNTATNFFQKCFNTHSLLSLTWS